MADVKKLKLYTDMFFLKAAVFPESGAKGLVEAAGIFDSTEFVKENLSDPLLSLLDPDEKIFYWNGEGFFCGVSLKGEGFSLPANTEVLTIETGNYLFLQQREQELMDGEAALKELESYALWNSLICKGPLFLRVIDEDGSRGFQWIISCRSQENLF